MADDQKWNSGPKNINQLSARLHNFGTRRLRNHTASDKQCAARVIFDDHLGELLQHISLYPIVVGCVAWLIPASLCPDTWSGRPGR